MKKILLFSAGVDSTCSLLYDKPDVALYIHGFTKYSDHEREAVNHIKFELGDFLDTEYVEIKMDFGSYEQPNANVPARNLLLLTAAAGWADTHFSEETEVQIILVAQRGEQHIPDRTPEFFTRTSNLLTDLTRFDAVHLSMGFPDMTKSQMVAAVLKLYPDELIRSILVEAFSCYYPEYGECRECPACLRKFIALYLNEIDIFPFQNKELFEEYVVKAQSGGYEKRRSEEIIKAYSLFQSDYGILS